jgi:hypothetical protein
VYPLYKTAWVIPASTTPTADVHVEQLVLEFTRRTCLSETAEVTNPLTFQRIY